MTYPYTITNCDRSLGLYLLRDRSAHVLVTVILVGDVDVVTRPDVIANIDTEMTDDSAPSSDQTPVTDSHNRISDAFLAGRHTCTQRYSRADHCGLTYLYVALVVDGVRRETNDAPSTETAEFLAAPIGRSNRTVELDSFPKPMDHAVHLSHATLPL